MAEKRKGKKMKEKKREKNSENSKRKTKGFQIKKGFPKRSRIELRTIDRQTPVPLGQVKCKLEKLYTKIYRYNYVVKMLRARCTCGRKNANLFSNAWLPCFSFWRFVAGPVV